MAGDSRQTPIGSQWWPSEWGPADQRGAANRITPEKVLQATKLIRTGKVYQLGRIYQEDIPLAGKRHFSLTILGSPTNGPTGENKMVSHDEMFSGEIGQVGTQMDGLGHVGVRLPDDDYFYNGFKRSEFSTARGLEKLGVENVGVFFTRGVLIDVATFKGVDRLEPDYEITAKDIEGALKSEGIEITSGDTVFIRTGHGKLWMKDNGLYSSGEPGIGLAAAQWLIEKNIVMVGADNWGIETFSPRSKSREGEVHQWFITKNGIYHLENLDLEQLAADRVYEFAFVFAPLRLKGATGSPGNPIAVR
jgi:kynurenine formamidase